MVPPFLPPGAGVPPHARALMGYPMQGGVMVPPGVSTSVAAPPLKEERNEEERVSKVSQLRECHWLRELNT